MSFLKCDFECGRCSVLMRMCFAKPVNFKHLLLLMVHDEWFFFCKMELHVLYFLLLHRWLNYFSAIAETQKNHVDIFQDFCPGKKDFWVVRPKRLDRKFLDNVFDGLWVPVEIGWHWWKKGNSCGNKTIKKSQRNCWIMKCIWDRIRVPFHAIRHILHFCRYCITFFRYAVG